MYKCQKCKQFSKPGEKANPIVTSFRPKKYHLMEYVVNDEGNLTPVQGKLQGEGFETIKEIRVCNKCLTEINSCLDQRQ